MVNGVEHHAAREPETQTLRISRLARRKDKDAVGQVKQQKRNGQGGCHDSTRRTDSLECASQPKSRSNRNQPKQLVMDGRGVPVSQPFWRSMACLQTNFTTHA